MTARTEVTDALEGCVYCLSTVVVPIVIVISSISTTDDGVIVIVIVIGYGTAAAWTDSHASVHSQS